MPADYGIQSVSVFVLSRSPKALFSPSSKSMQSILKFVQWLATVSAAKEARPASQNHRTPTLNSYGFSWDEIAPVAMEWADFDGPGPSLDIGCAYGDTALMALLRGRNVIANDLDSRHLRILDASAAGLPPALRDRLRIIEGRFPEDLNFADGSIGSVLMSSVLHFLSGSQVREGLAAISRWLAPGGKVYIASETPFMGIFKSLDFEARRKSGMSEFPGLMTREEISKYSPHASNLPELMNWFDAETLERELKKVGLVIEGLEYFTRPGLPEHLRWDGRESLMAVARK